MRAKPTYAELEKRVEELEKIIAEASKDPGSFISRAAQSSTDRIEAEQRLRESKERFQKVFNSQLDAIFLLDADHPPRILESNRAASEIFGYPSGELIGETTEKLHVDAARLKIFQQKFIASFEKTGYLQNCEFSMKRKDGSVFPSEHTVLALKNDGGDRIGWVSIVRDLTERKEMRRRLEQAQKMEAMGTLSGGITHDFNNILFPLLGHAEMLKDAMPSESPLHQHVDVIIDSILRARDLVRQILTFSRQGEQVMRPIRLQPILKEALKLMRVTIPTIIDFKTDIDPECGIVMADPTQIHQIIMNLTTNAFHAMEEAGGKLCVSYRQTHLEDDPSPLRNLPRGEYALLTVADTGIGIQQEVMDKVFDPYFTTKEKQKGTGLGLSVVRGIVENCGGEIHIDSKRGRGTAVQVWLPIAEDLHPEPGDDENRPVSGGNERIMLVDDDENVVLMIQIVLEGLGYKITAHTKSIDALEAFKEDPEGFDLIYSDVTMPLMTGDQLARKIREIRPGIPIILSTGFSGRIDSEKCREMGIQGFVMKPVSRQKIAGMVRKILDEAQPIPEAGPKKMEE